MHWKYKRRTWEPRRKQANRDKRLARAKGIRADREELDKSRKISHGGQAAGASTWKGKDHAGVQICYSFANGTEPCRTVEPGAACLQAQKRAHKCQHCLSPGHRNSDCPKKA